MPTVLVIDDDQAVRTAIQIGLRQNQFLVLEATTARAGLEMLNSHRIDLVLCDFHLGGIDEVGGFAALRESAARAGVRFLGMTGESQLAEQQRNVLVKPFSLATLLRVIEETLAKDVEPFVRGEPAPGKNNRKKGDTGPASSLPPITALMVPPQPSLAQMEEILARVQALRETERRELARIIHDDLIQSLTVLAIELSLLQGNVNSETGEQASAESISHGVRKLTGLVNELIGSAQGITARLRPKVLDEFGLCAGLEWLVEQVELQSGIRCELSTEGQEGRIDSRTAEGIFRLLEDILGYAVRYGNGAPLALRLVFGAESISAILSYTVTSNGQKASEKIRNLDLAAMSLRAKQLRGSFGKMTNSPGKRTTTLRIDIPVT